MTWKYWNFHRFLFIWKWNINFRAVEVNWWWQCCNVSGSVLLLLGWFLPLPRFLYWLGYLVPFLILSEDDEDQEIREYLAKRKRLKKGNLLVTRLSFTLLFPLLVPFSKVTDYSYKSMVGGSCHLLRLSLQAGSKYTIKWQTTML